MDRDWDAEWAAIEAEVVAARKALDAAHRPASPEVSNPGKIVSTAVLATYGEASRHFEAATARQSAFLAERKVRDPKWNGSA